MAKIQKLYKREGKDKKTLVYPATITQAVKDGETGQNLHEYMNDIKPKFKFDATQTDSQLGTVGTIQLSQDGGKTWNPISPEFLNNLRIQGYVATTSALPTGKPVGTIYGVGPTYAASDSAHTNPIYRLYVYNGSSWVDNGVFTSIAAGIVQETGNSETEVMSQKAVTEKLAKLESEVYKSCIVGDGNNIVSNKIYGLVEGCIYRLTFKNPQWDTSGINMGGSPSIFYIGNVIGGNENYVTNALLGGTVKKQYEFSVAQNTDYINIEFRATKGVEIWYQIEDITNEKILFNSNNVSLVYPMNIDTKNKVLDFGEDILLCIGDTTYQPNKAEHRAVPYYDTDSGAAMILFNIDTLNIYPKVHNYKRQKNEVLLGSVNSVYATHEYKSASFPFTYKVDGKYSWEFNDQTLAEINSHLYEQSFEFIGDAVAHGASSDIYNVSIKEGENFILGYSVQENMIANEKPYNLTITYADGTEKSVGDCIFNELRQFSAEKDIVSFGVYYPAGLLSGSTKITATLLVASSNVAKVSKDLAKVSLNTFGLKLQRRVIKYETGIIYSFPLGFVTERDIASIIQLDLDDSLHFSTSQLPVLADGNSLGNAEIGQPFYATIPSGTSSISVYVGANDATAKGILTLTLSPNNEIAPNVNYVVRGINHRGWHNAPENTLSAFRESRKNGFDYVECDVAFTKDNVAVLLHDDTIDRTSDGTGNIGDYTYEELLAFDFGSWKSAEYVGEKIPTFESFIILCRNLGLHPYIEVKANNSSKTNVENVVNIVKSCGMKGRVTYISFSSQILTWIKEADEKARLGFVVDYLVEDTISVVNGLKTDANEVFVDAALTADNIRNIGLCIEGSIPLEVWTVNSSDSIINANAYISGFTSDSLIAGKVLFDATFSPK